MSESILDSVKKALSIPTEYTEFDAVIIMYINSAFSTLNELGIGPSTGFMIEDGVAVWDDFTAGDIRYNSVKTYVSFRCRLMFDPPAAAFVLTSMETQIKELEWRLNAVRENLVYGS